MKVMVIRSLNSAKNRSQHWKRENSLSYTFRKIKKERYSKVVVHRVISVALR